MHAVVPLVAVAVAALAGCARFGDVERGGASQPAASGIGRVAFLAGTWRGEALGGIVEETWYAPRDGVMLGMFRLTGTPDRGAEAFRIAEFFMIEEEPTDGGPRVVMRFKHFRRAYAPVETDAPLTLHLVRADASTAVFEQAPGTRPLRITYARTPAGLTCTIESEHEGKPEILNVPFRRAGV
jgi:hypothetical protein